MHTPTIHNWGIGQAIAGGFQEFRTMPLCLRGCCSTSRSHGDYDLHGSVLSIYSWTWLWRVCDRFRALQGRSLHIANSGACEMNATGTSQLKSSGPSMSLNYIHSKKGLVAPMTPSPTNLKGPAAFIYQTPVFAEPEAVHKYIIDLAIGPHCRAL